MWPTGEILRAVDENISQTFGIVIGEMRFLSENHAWNASLFRGRPLHNLPALTSNVSYAGSAFPFFCQPLHTDAGHVYKDREQWVRGSEKIHLGQTQTLV